MLKNDKNFLVKSMLKIFSKVFIIELANKFYKREDML